MRAALIHNGGGGSASEDDLAAVRELMGGAFELETYTVEDGVSPVDLAQKALAAGHTLLIASGGDGTVSAVSSAAVGKLDVSVGILPRGTANSIAGHLGIPSDVEGACRVIIEGHERVIDTAVVSSLGPGSASVEGRPMLLMATLGLHAEAITDANPEHKKRFGVLAYVVEAVSKMMEDSLFEVTLEADDHRPVTLRASAVTIANVAPPSSLFAQGTEKVVDDDGLLDVTIVAMEGLADAVATSFHLATAAVAGWPAERDNIAAFRTARLKVTTAAEKRLMVDGEDVGTGSFSVHSVPRSLRVRVPQTV